MNRYVFRFQPDKNKTAFSNFYVKDIVLSDEEFGGGTVAANILLNECVPEYLNKDHVVVIQQKYADDLYLSDKYMDG